MIVWIELATVQMLHDRQIAEHGGSAGLRDAGLLASALARPQQLYSYGDPPPDLAALAASLAHGIAKNHAFVDGNKRTAFVAYRTFLALNHAHLDATPDEKYLTILSLADGRISEADFAAWLRTRLKLDLPGHGVQEQRAGYAGKSSAKTTKARQRAVKAR
ncbi:MAG TPA: type II toxin-antitoxin system death-on-curing family toxin [Fontimonas sp.]